MSESESDRNMIDRDTLAGRMKRYEAVYRATLTPRSCVIVRCDGRAFHSLKLQSPFDNHFMVRMVVATKDTAIQMQGFKLAYVQSDEASFLLTDFDELTTQGWFDYDLQKITSISASLMSVSLSLALQTRLQFDSRAFVIPREDVANYFLWRARDWERNSLSMYCRAHFSHAQLEGKDKAARHEMLYGINLNWATDLNERERNGTFVMDGGEEEQTNILPNYKAITEAINPWGAP